MNDPNAITEPAREETTAGKMYCPAYHAGQSGNNPIYYYYGACTCEFPLDLIQIKSTDKNLQTGCPPPPNPECGPYGTEYLPGVKRLNGDDIKKTTSPTRFMYFHKIDPSKPFAKAPEAANATVHDLARGVTLIPPRNLQVAGLPAPVRLFLLVVVPPFEPPKRELPPFMVTVGFEIEKGGAEIQRVEYSTEVVTPYYCRVYEPSLDVVYHVQMVTPINLK